MSEKFQLKGGICEVNFGYHSKLEGYTTLMSDIPKLYEIARISSRGKTKRLCAHYKIMFHKGI